MKVFRGFWWTIILSSVIAICLILFYVFKTNTVYAPGFSIWKYHGVSLGESIDTVIDRLGEPLSIIDFSEKNNACTNIIPKQDGQSLSNGLCWLRYSLGADGNCDFICFQIAVSNGIVSSKDCFIYRD